MGVRHDQTTDPDVLAALLQARRGTAFFARKLNELSDADLDGDSLLPGWSRRHVIAHVGYNARAIARLVGWAATGVEDPMYPSTEVRDHEIVFGATLSPIALRHLFDHSAVHLNVEWRDLATPAWHHLVRTIQGREVPATETVWMRSREIWVHAVDLDNGAALRDLPVSVLERLLADITGAWHARGTDTNLVCRVTDQPQILASGDMNASSPLEISGRLADVVSWATGRGPAGVMAYRSGEAVASVPSAPRWI